MRQHALRRRGLEERHLVGERRPDVRALLRHGERQPERVVGRSHPEPPGRHPAQRQAGPRGAPALLEGHGHLEERGVHPAALHPQLLHQPLEGDRLVHVPAQGDLAHPPDELRERGVPRQARADREHVGEQADEPFQLHAAASGHGGPHHHVLFPGVPPQQQLPGGQKGHVERGLLAAGERPQRPDHGIRQHDGAAPRALALPRGGRVVGGEVEDRRSARQLVPPVGELLLQRLPREPLPLPQGEVGVLHRQLGQPRLRAARKGAVEGGHLPRQDFHAPAVGNDVVHGEGEDVLLPAQAEEAHPQQGPPGEVEGDERLLHGQSVRLGVRPLRPEPAQVRRRQRQGSGRVHPLHRVPVAPVEGGPQHLVAADQLRERAPQRRRVERPPQAEGVDHVVGGGPRLHLVDEPEPLLRVGERRRLAPRPPPDPLRGRPGAGVLPQQLLQQGTPLHGELRHALFEGAAHGAPARPEWGAPGAGEMARIRPPGGSGPRRR